MTISKDAASIMESQYSRLAQGPNQTRLYPQAQFKTVVGLMEEKGFVAVEKNDDTIWGCYRQPQTLLVMDRTISVAKGKQIGQRVSFFSTDGGKISANYDVKELFAELGI